MDMKETLSRLNEEREYEDKLAQDLDGYFIDSLPYIDDVSDEEKDEIRKQLRIIIYDSIRHGFLFTEMIEMVLDNGEDKY